MKEDFKDKDIDMYFIDTNIFLQYLMNDNPQSFEDTYNLLSLLQEKKIETYYSLSVVSELVYVLIKYYKIEKEIVIYYINSLFVNYRKLDEYNLSLAMKLYKDNNVKYGDAIISSNSEIQAGRVMIVSYDKDFDKLGVIRKEPRQVIKEIKNQISKHQTLKPEAYSCLTCLATGKATRQAPLEKSSK